LRTTERTFNHDDVTLATEVSEGTEGKAGLQAEFNVKTRRREK
jgi:hypothetical protein